MMNWKDKLTEKETEFNLTKGGENGTEASRILSTDRSSSSGSDNSIDVHKTASGTDSAIGNRSGDILRRKISKQIDNNNDKERRNIEMISAEHALADYEAIVKENVSAEEKLVKIQKILIKLLLSIRTNQMGGVRKDKEPVVPTTPQQ